MVECGACGSDETERLTGEILPFVGRPTVFDRAYGWTYLSCPDCGFISNYWTDRVVTWDKSQMALRLEELRILEASR